MKHITVYLDFISPYAFLAFEKLPETLQGISHSVTYKPLLFAGLLKHHGQLGPAEIPGKREWTYRQVMWLAQKQGVTLKLPASHPFNPLSLLRLAVACDARGTPNRYVCETIFRHVWQTGLEAADAQRGAALAEQLKPQRDVSSAEVKAQLTAHSDEAIAQGVFGVPTMVVDGKLFWGLDGLPMLRDFLLGEAWFDQPHWKAAAQLPSGAPRQK